MTGHTESVFTRPGFRVDSDVQILRRSTDVRTDFARTIKPALTRCLAVFLRQSTPSAMNVRARRLSFPRIGDVSALYRITAAVQANRKPFPLVIDIALVGTGRTEFGLPTTGPVRQRTRLVSSRCGSCASSQPERQPNHL